VPGAIVAVVVTVTINGAGDPATVVSAPFGATEIHGAEFAVFTVTLPAELDVTLIN